VVIFYLVLFLTSGIRALSLGRHCGKIFFIFADFFFRRRKKRAATFSKFLVYFCEKFVEKGLYLISSQKNTQFEKKKSSETESGKSRY
jgi:hypothetical protein